MKKSIIFTLLLAFIGCSSLVNAQSLAVFLGFKMGPSFANFEGKDVSTKLTSRIGFGFGLVSDFSIKKANNKDFSRWSLCPEINYVPGGSVDKTSSGSITNDITCKFNSVRVPILIRFYHGFLGEAKSGVFAEVGPYGGYLLSAKETGTVKDSSVTVDVNEDVKKYFEDTDYGVSFGGGVSIASILTINYRYDWGLANIKKADKFKSDYDVTNRAWGIYFNLCLPIGQ
jgi:hypothetical protein